jgi:DNA-binding PucR family transcriptional regulator
LYVHRNTLLYRLQRAAEIGKFDLDKAETRLAIQLALRAYEISRDESEFLPPL